MFTKKENKRQANDTRPKRLMWKRRADTPQTVFSKLITLTAKQSEYQQVDVKEVLNTFIEVMQKEILAGNAVVIPDICTILPMVKPARNCVNFNRYTTQKPELMVTPAKYVLKMFPNLVMERNLKEVEVTTEAVEKIYVK